MQKYKPSYWIIVSWIFKKALKKKFNNQDIRIIRKNAHKEYKNLLKKADDIGNNEMAANLYLVLAFLSFYTGNKDKISKECFEFLVNDFISNDLVVKIMSKTNYNCSKDFEKFKNKMYKNAQWAKANSDKYPETWIFDFNSEHKDGFYYAFKKCPIAKFFKDNKMEDMCHIFCNLDFKTCKLKHANLFRDKTIAKGDEICDFWVVPDEIQNPR